MMSSPPSARPYRSKRHRPCDQCRARKLGCQTGGGIPCQRCRDAKLDCTFENPPPKRARLSESLSFVEPSIDELMVMTHPIASAEQSPLERVASDFPALGFDDVEIASPRSGILLPDRPPTQFVQSIDKLDQGYAQLFGASSESDPWLLRHCRFDDSGMKHFYKVHYRNAGGVPTAQRIPIHFMITSQDMSSSIRQETQAGPGDVTREQLNCLVPPEYGRRLVGL